MAKYTITLSDGTKFEDLTLNGNNFITGNETYAAKLRATLGRVTNILKDVIIAGDAQASEDSAGLIGKHEFMELVQCVKVGGNWWFVLRDLSVREVRDLKIDARLDYLEMMTEE